MAKKRINLKELIPNGRDNVVFTVSPQGQLLAKMTEENAFDFLLNKGVIDNEQFQTASDFYFCWYNGVVAMHGKITQTYDTVGGGGGGMNITEFHLNCREKYYNLCSLLEPEARKLLNSFCEGKRAPEIEKDYKLPRYYANARLRSALDVLAMFLGYKTKKKI